MMQLQSNVENVNIVLWKSSDYNPIYNWGWIELNTFRILKIVKSFVVNWAWSVLCMYAVHAHLFNSIYKSAEVTVHWPQYPLKRHPACYQLTFKIHFIHPHSLSELQDFIKMANTGLTKGVEEGDYDGLVDCMGHLMEVKQRQSQTDVMFEPLKQTIELLKTYDQEMSEEVHTQLQVR